MAGAVKLSNYNQLLLQKPEHIFAANSYLFHTAAFAMYTDDLETFLANTDHYSLVHHILYFYSAINALAFDVITARFNISDLIKKSCASI